MESLRSGLHAVDGRTPDRGSSGFAAKRTENQASPQTVWREGAAGGYATIRSPRPVVLSRLGHAVALLGGLLLALLAVVVGLALRGCR
jgi:hypothetical protein